MKTYTKSLIPHARYMRSNMTEPEKRMWYQCLKHLPLRFRRQRPVGPYIVDFVCLSRRLVIEADGGQHNEEQAAHDAARTTWLEARGYSVLRFWNNDILGNIEGVGDVIRRKLAELA